MQDLFGPGTSAYGRDRGVGAVRGVDRVDRATHSVGLTRSVGTGHVASLLGRAGRFSSARRGYTDDVDAGTRSVLVGRYEIGPLIGRGGMAEVRRGFDRVLMRAVAVKCFDPAGVSARGRARFEAEARLAASVSHPNVVAVYDVGIDGDMPFLVMECLPGTTLADAIRSGPMGVPRVIAIARELLSALAAAHDCGVVHRDLKPGNVLFTDNGHVKLADFGIATSPEAGDLTETGMVLGTPAYLAPERIRGEPATARSDLYSVGVMCYEALSGVRPFGGESSVAVAYAVTHAPVRPLHVVRPDVPRAVADVVMCAMARNPDDRFDSARALASALGLAAERPAADHDATMPLVISTPDATEMLPVVDAPVRVHRASRRRRRVLAPTFGVLALLTLLVGGLLVSRRDSAVATRQPARTSSTTTASLPPRLAAPFDELQRAVRP
jgi:serine/threonine protein kinase